MNDALDLLEQESFFNADVFIMPPENGESDGDSEDSGDDTKQCLYKPFAEHLTSQILKGDGTGVFRDEGGVHVIEGPKSEQSAVAASSADSDGERISSDKEKDKTTTDTEKKRKRQVSQRSDMVKQSKIAR